MNISIGFILEDNVQHLRLQFNVSQVIPQSCTLVSMEWNFNGLINKYSSFFDPLTDGSVIEFLF